MMLLLRLARSTGGGPAGQRLAGVVGRSARLQRRRGERSRPRRGAGLAVLLVVGRVRMRAVGGGGGAVCSAVRTGRWLLLLLLLLWLRRGVGRVLRLRVRWGGEVAV
jgi:hypothetical protein